MERLTREKQIGPFAALKDKAESVPGAFNTYDCFYAHAIAVTRLKQYEDTGMTPEEVSELASPEVVEVARLLSNMLEEGSAQHMAELFEAEKDGRLVMLPCKPGTELFGHCRIRGAQPISHSYYFPPYVPKLGVDAWLTREEAEAALKKREE